MSFDPDEVRRRIAADGKNVIPAVRSHATKTEQQTVEQIDTDQDELADLGKYNKTKADMDIDRLLDNLDIITTYVKFCGKMVPRVGNRTESIMISCPKPDHPDKNPSAWVNTQSGQWYCAACEQGGDKYDIAAHNLGYPVPGYKTTQRHLFPQLRRDMAKRLGYTVVRGLSGRSEFLVPPSGEQLEADDVPESHNSGSGVPTELQQPSSRTGGLNGHSPVPPPPGRTPAFPSSKEHTTNGHSLEQPGAQDSIQLGSGVLSPGSPAVTSPVQAPGGNSSVAQVSGPPALRPNTFTDLVARFNSSASGVTHGATSTNLSSDGSLGVPRGDVEDTGSVRTNGFSGILAGRLSHNADELRESSLDESREITGRDRGIRSPSQALDTILKDGGEVCSGGGGIHSPEGEGVLPRHGDTDTGEYGSDSPLGGGTVVFDSPNGLYGDLGTVLGGGKSRGGDVRSGLEEVRAASIPSDTLDTESGLTAPDTSSGRGDGDDLKRVRRTKGSGSKLPTPDRLDAPGNVSVDTDNGGATVTSIAPESDPESDKIINPDRYFIYPSINWRELVPEQTFLWDYLTCCAPDEVPEEYHFWGGLMAIGQALGRNTVLFDRKPVYGNLFVCTVGPSGSGKSSASAHVINLLRQALPWEAGDPDTRGSKTIATPGSAEAMIGGFTREIALDPDKPRAKTAFPVKGIVEFSELASLVGKSSRLGSVLQSTLIDFYDARRMISTSAVTSGEKVALDSFCSVITTTQLKSLRELFTAKDAASGFLNRWVFAMGPLKDRSPIGGAIIDITPSVASLKSIVGWSSSVPMIKWSPDALKLFSEFWYESIRPTKEADENDIFTRIDLLCKKLVLLFAANAHESVVSFRSVWIVKQLFPYLLDTYKAIEARFGSSIDYEIGKNLAETIQHLTEKYKKPPTMREIKLWTKGKKYTNEQYAKQMNYLIQVGTIEELSPEVKKIGRPSGPRYRYVG